jgi:hypothetical protein
MNPEDILEGLTQEERLDLLERLIQEASKSSPEELSLENRVRRLEAIVGWRHHRTHQHHPHPHTGSHCCCC